MELADNSEEITLIQKQINLIQKQGDTLTNSQSSNLRNLDTLLKTKKKGQRFKILPETHKVTIKVKPTHICDLQESFKCKMTHFPININTASTSRKLQGRSTDMIIVTS